MVRVKIIKKLKFMEKFSPSNSSSVMAAIFSPAAVTGFKYFNLDNYTKDIPWLKWPMFVAVVFAAVSFIIAVYYISKYTKGFYAGREIPKSWKFITWGILSTALAEVGEIFLFYETAQKVGLVEKYLFLDLPHAIGGIFLAIGAYKMLKEVSS